ncbi:MAG: hypothetical protein JOY71_14250 [Acetobacteraceae bacterium]|nr:hypothetical protein [Acetobacteraceae bacterium]
MMMSPSAAQRMPGRYWYAVAILLWIGGAICAGLIMWAGLSGMGAGLVRGIMPGSLELTLDKPGTYTIFHETNSLIDGRIYTSQSADGLHLQVSAQPSGTPVQVNAASGMNYTLGGHEGSSIAAFAIETPGAYRLVATYPNNRTGPPVALAVGGRFMGSLLGTILGAFAIGFAGFAAALAIVIVTFIRRRRAISASSAAAGAAVGAG